MGAKRLLMRKGKAKSEVPPVNLWTPDRGSTQAFTGTPGRSRKIFRKNLQAESAVLSEMARL